MDATIEEFLHRNPKYYGDLIVHDRLFKRALDTPPNERRSFDWYILDLNEKRGLGPLGPTAEDFRDSESHNPTQISDARYRCLLRTHFWTSEGVTPPAPNPDYA